VIWNRLLHTDASGGVATVESLNLRCESNNDEAPHTNLSRTWAARNPRQALGGGISKVNFY